MPDYSKSIIYKIVCKDLNIKFLYIGSTTNLKNRINKHKSDCNNVNNKKYNQKKYIKMRKNGGFGNFDIIKIEDYPCNNKREVEKREEEIRIELKANMNARRCYLTPEEKKFYDNECRKNYNERNKETIKIYRNEYEKINKDVIKEQKKKYRELNKEKLKLKFICECGSECRHSDRNRHFNTVKHQNYIKSLNDNS